MKTMKIDSVFKKVILTLFIDYELVGLLQKLKFGIDLGSQPLFGDKNLKNLIKRYIVRSQNERGDILIVEFCFKISCQI